MVADPADFFDLAPERVAVVLIDFQNDFCSPEVAASAQPTNTNNAAAARRANDFAAAAADAGAHVLYTRQILDLDRLPRGNAAGNGPADCARPDPGAPNCSSTRCPAAP